MNMIVRIATRTCLCILFLAQAACSPEESDIAFWEADIEPGHNSRASGIVRFSQQSGYVHVTGTIEGLEPGPHDVTLFEPGTCNELAAAGTTLADADDRRIADIAEITADHRGQAMIDIGRSETADSEGSVDMLGRSVVISVSDAGPVQAAACGDIRPVPIIDYTP